RAGPGMGCLGLTRGDPPEQARRPEHQDKDQDGKDDHIGPAGRYELSAEGFDEPDGNAPDHGARDAADAAEDRRGEGPEAGGVTDNVAREVVIEAEDQARGAGQGRAEE